MESTEAERTEVYKIPVKTAHVALVLIENESGEILLFRRPENAQYSSGTTDLLTAEISDQSIYYNLPALRDHMIAVVEAELGLQVDIYHSPIGTSRRVGRYSTQEENEEIRDTLRVFLLANATAPEQLPEGYYWADLNKVVVQIIKEGIGDFRRRSIADVIVCYAAQRKDFIQSQMGGLRSLEISVQYDQDDDEIAAYIEETPWDYHGICASIIATRSVNDSGQQTNLLIAGF